MKKTKRSLGLNRETVRTLTSSQLIDVGGGQKPEKTITCSPGSDCCSYLCTSYSVA